MQLVAGYFDETTDAQCYVVAGFVASQHAAAVLELRWRDLLKEYDIEYFKASELSAGEGQFKRFRDDPNATAWQPFSNREKKKFQEIKTRFTDCLVGCRGLYGIGAALVLSDYERLLSEHRLASSVLPQPFYLCAAVTLMDAGMLLYENNGSLREADKGYIQPIFDSHEEYSGPVKQTFDEFCEKNPRSSKYMLPPLYEKEQNYLTLQAADDLAFEVRKLLLHDRFNMPLVERRPMMRLKEGRRVAVLYKLDYVGLKMIADAQASDRITD